MLKFKSVMVNKVTIMTDKSVQELVQDELNKIDQSLAKEVLQLNLTRSEAETFLKTNRVVPFIIRQSSQSGFLSLDLFYPIQNHFGRYLIQPPTDIQPEFQLFSLQDGIQTYQGSLQKILSDFLAERKKEANPTAKIDAPAVIPEQAMSMELAQQKLKEAVTALNLNLPEQIFQFDFNREQTELYLNQHPEIPFILRQSNEKGFLTLSCQGKSVATLNNVLIDPPNTEHQDFQFCSVDDKGIKTLLKPAFEDAIKEQIQRRTLTLEHWQKFKKHLATTGSIAAVISTQSLDKENVAFASADLEQAKQNRPSLGQIDPGHSGFAMSLALHAPFVVFNDSDQREKANLILKDHLSAQGLIIITGHGLADGDSISGTFTRNGSDITVERSPTEIVQALLEAGVKKGDHPVLLLSVCFAAAKENSLAHKLAKELAKQGISSTIIASDKPVSRFGHSVIENDRVTFNADVGIAPQEVCVFTTEVQDKENNPSIKVYRPNETIQLSASGLSFLTVEELALQKVQDEALKKKKEQAPEFLIKLKTNVSLINLFNAINQMAQYGVYLQGLESNKASVVKNLAFSLNDKLEFFLINSVKTFPSPEELLHFQKKFKDLLHSEDKLMSVHREQWKPILANILLALTGVGFLLILAKLTYSAVNACLNKQAMSFNNSFFFAKTSSEQLEEKIESTFNQVDFNEQKEKNWLDIERPLLISAQ